MLALLLIGALLAFTPLGSNRWWRYAPAAISAALFLGFLGYAPAALSDTPLLESFAWVPALGLTLSAYLDGLALLFALLITGVGVVVTVYSIGYFEEDAEFARFSGLLLGFMMAMLGVVLAGNIITLFIAYEGTSILSFLLIGFDGGSANKKSKGARIGALRALIITGAGGLALLVGLVMLGSAAGTSELPQILSNTDLRTHPLYMGFTLLILLGAFTKSAQFPFHFWLPGAMSAPSPASAYLHAATMVKAGIYVALRFQPVLGNTEFWMWTVTGVGLITFVLGAMIATRQRDMKGLLAYTTVSALGSLMALIGLPDSIGIKAALVGILAHGMYKAALFLITGAIEHKTGTRDLDHLGGLRKTMPVAFVVTLISTFSMAGVPIPLLGFMAKDKFLEAHFPEELGSILPLIGAFAGSVFMVVAALTVLRDAFLRPAPEPAHHDHDHHTDDDHHHDTPILSWAPMALAVVTVGLPLMLGWLQPLTDAILGKVSKLELYPAHPEPLIVSVAALLVGALLVPTRARWSNVLRIRGLPTATRLYNGLIEQVERAGRVALRLQNGQIHRYLLLVWLAFVVLLGILLVQIGSDIPDTLERSWQMLRLNVSVIEVPDILRALLLIGSIIMTVASIRARRHLSAALMLGVSGYLLGGVFLLEPAPDVALVQILVETTGTVLIVVMIARMGIGRKRVKYLEKRREILTSGTTFGTFGDIAVSVSVALIIGFVSVVAVLNRPERESIASWHLINTYQELKITDAVGGIVTDFRGFDTMLEITVLSIAALGVYTLFSSGSNVTSRQEEKYTPPFNSPLARVFSRLILPFAFLIAFNHLLYGGGGPGDGFTAGVIGALAISLFYIVRGYYGVRTLFVWLKPRLFILIGLSIAVGNALIWAIFEGLPVLRVRQIGDAPAGLHFSSTLFFEVAIMVTVFGAVLMIMDTLAHPEDADEPK
jgi:NADH:ubiquinone oxidoreductase subunit 5 (subunit L)/multisubunit Na+/H+ antiporter MnhA subunit/multisubunit Na+/H+ antiporter MnhB subunit